MIKRQNNVKIKTKETDKIIERDSTMNEQFYSESNVKAISESIKQLLEGKVVVKTIEELKELENR